VPGGRLGSFVIAPATALVILGGSILPFLTPVYIRVEQERAGVERLTGWDSGLVYEVTGSIVGDLLFARGDFDVAVGDTPVLNDRERGHMRDVRGVFLGFFALVAVSAVVLLVVFRRASGPVARAASWRAVGSGARGLAIALAVAGAFALFAFDAAFEVFHELFFSAGSYTFDPRTDRLVQLFPEQFWSDTAIAVGAVAIAVAVLTAWQAGRRAGAAKPAAAFTTSTART
jgi:integral membrane protein (TIGR01906 family)